MEKTHLEILDSQVQSGFCQVSFKTPHFKYVDRILRSNSYVGLAPIFFNADSPAKELSESYAALSNLKKVCNVSRYLCLHLGDGGWGRTGVIFSFFSKSYNISIDPMINNTGKFERWCNDVNIERYIFFKDKFEEVNDFVTSMFLLPEVHNLPKILVSVHGHINLEKAALQYSDVEYIYTNPCCQFNNQTLSKEFCKEKGWEVIVNKVDFGILSEKRRVIIYKKI